MEASTRYIRKRTVIHLLACIHNVMFLAFLVSCSAGRWFSKGLSCPQLQTKHALSGRNAERTIISAYSYSFLKQKPGRTTNDRKRFNLNSIRSNNTLTSKISISRSPLLASQNRIFSLLVILTRDTPPGQGKPLPPANVPEIIFFDADDKAPPSPPRTTTTRTEGRQRKQEARRTRVHHPSTQTEGTASPARLASSAVNTVQTWLALAMSFMSIPFLFPLTIVCWISYVRAMRQLYGMEPPASVRNFYWIMFTLLLLMHLLLLIALLSGL